MALALAVGTVATSAGQTTGLVANGAFETGSLSGWTTTTGAGWLFPWSAQSAPGGHVFVITAAEGDFVASNVFDGNPGTSIQLFQELTIPSTASSAILEWRERVRWAFTSTSPPSRTYEVRIEASGGTSLLQSLFTLTLNPATGPASGDTGWVHHSFDLLNVADIRGRTIRVNFRASIATGTAVAARLAQIDLDQVRLAVSRDGVVPPNNSCTEAAIIGPGLYFGDTQSATPDGLATCDATTQPSHNDIWFSYTPKTSGTATISLPSFAAGAVLSLHNNCPGFLPLNTQLSCATSASGSPTLSFSATASVRYLIRVGHRAGSGKFTLRLTGPADGAPPPPVNDRCSAATAVSSGQINGTTVHATNDGTASLVESSSTSDVWYLYVPSQTGVATFSLCNTASFDTVLSLHAACPGTVANQLAINDDFPGCSFSSQLSFQVVVGTPYRIRVSGYNGQTGSFTLSISGPPSIHFLTEQFDSTLSDNFDLANRELRLAPNGTADFYDICVDPVTSYPTSPTGSGAVTLTSFTNVSTGQRDFDDGTQRIDLTGGARVQLYGVSYSSVFVNVNGSLTFGQGDAHFRQSLERHFQLPRVAPLFGDMKADDPLAGAVSAKVSYRQLTDRLAITYENMKPFLEDGTRAHFQIQLFFDGRITITHLSTTIRSGITGLSRGTGGGSIPQGYVERKLANSRSCSFPPDLVASNISLRCEGPSQLFGDVALLNQGTGAAGPFQVGVYLSTDPIITTEDTFIAFARFNSGLPASQMGTASGAFAFNLEAFNLAPGTYVAGAVVDDQFQVSESDETNNALAGNELALPCAGAPANDRFADAFVISGASGTTTGSNVGATKETGEPNHARNVGGRSVWWSWTAPASGTATFNTFSSNFDTLLAIYTGTSVSGLTLVGENDDAGTGLQSQVVFTAAAGTTYKIAVDGFNEGAGAASGSIMLNWFSAAPSPTATPTPTPEPTNALRQKRWELYR